MDKRKFIRPAIIAVLLILLVAATGYCASKNSNGKEETQESSFEVPESESSMDTEYNLIEGGYSFFPDDILPDGAQASMYTLPPSVCGIDLPYTLKDSPFVVTRIAKYSGEYVEDMSDDQIDSCLAIIVKNNTDDLVMTATIVFKVNDSEEAEFKVNTLPAGESCVVLEQNRRPFKTEDKLEYDSENPKNSYYTRSADEQKKVDVSDKIQINYSDDELIIRNRGSETYEKIYVLYKNVRENIYLGGITYKLEFSDLGPGMEKTQKSLHYAPDSVKVLAINSES